MSKIIQRNSVLLFLFTLALLLAGCGGDDGVGIKISGGTDFGLAVRKGTLLKQEGAVVGVVTAVNTNEGVVYSAYAQIDKKAAAQLKSELAFIVRQTEGQPAFLDVLTLNKDSAPLRDGTMYRISENENNLSWMNITVNHEQTPTWRLWAFLGFVMVIIVFIILIPGIRLKLMPLAICLSVGCLGVFGLWWVPDNIIIIAAGIVLGFLLPFFVAWYLMHVVFLFKNKPDPVLACLSLVKGGDDKVSEDNSEH